MNNNLTTKNFFTTKKIHEEITTKTFTKSGVNPYIQQFKNLYIINKIIADKSFHKGDYVGCKLNTKNLTLLFGNKHAQTCAIIKDLTDWGIIHKTANAAIGADAARYALTDQYSADGILILPVDTSDAGFVKKLIDFDKIENDKTLKQLSININNISINTNGISYLTNKYSSHTIDGVVDLESAFNVSRATIIDDKSPKFLLGGVEIDMIDLPLIQIYLKDFNTSRPDQKSRVFNNLTNLKREFREYIDFNGKPLLMTDISNSQVLLSVAAVKKQYSITSGIGMIGLYEDVKHYQQLAESGMFYEYLIEKSGYKGDRNKFKKDFFSQVFFSKVVKYSMPIKDAFVEEFPNVYALINQLKEKDYRQFAISMQRMEASIMIDTVAKKMIKSGKSILTLHDAIVCDNMDDIQLAEQLISDVMVKYNIIPQFKRETCEKYVEAPVSAEVAPVNNEEYNEELDTVTIVASGTTYYFGNNTIISSNLSDSADVKELRHRLIESKNDKIYYKNKIYEFARCNDGDEVMIFMVA